MRKGQKHTEETKQRMKETSKNPETIARRSAAQQRIGKDPEVKKTRSENSTKQWENEEYYTEHTGENHPFYGKKHTDETKQKISEKGMGNKYGEKLKGRKQSPEHIAKRFPFRKMKPLQKSKQLKCIACKYKFDKEIIERNEGFCDECVTHTTICECGCNEIIFRYNKDGSLRRFKDVKHIGNASRKPKERDFLSKEERLTLRIIRQRETFHKKRERRKIDPEFDKQEYDRKSNATKKAFENNPGLKDLHREITIRMFEDPEYRKQHSEKSKGESNPNWNGGTSFLPYDEKFNDEFKDMIRRRQNYECADGGLGNCTYDERELCVHHINRVKTDSFPENCIALCFYHHSISHNEKARIRHREFVTILMCNKKD